MGDQNQIDLVVFGTSLDEKFLVLLQSRQKSHFLFQQYDRKLCKQTATKCEAITNFRENKKSYVLDFFLLSLCLGFR